jgi:hypothetical protein
MMLQSGFTPGDVVGIELDLDNDNIRFLVNGKVSPPYTISLLHVFIVILQLALAAVLHCA